MVWNSFMKFDTHVFCRVIYYIKNHGYFLISNFIMPSVKFLNHFELCNFKFYETTFLFKKIKHFYCELNDLWIIQIWLQITELWQNKSVVYIICRLLYYIDRLFVFLCWTSIPLVQKKVIGRVSFCEIFL